jgi:uncharacterized membrane protein HdeD (DUF308 family)
LTGVKAAISRKADICSAAQLSEEAEMSVDQRLDMERLDRAVAKAVHDHWKLFLAEGIVLVLLGAAAIIIPAIATLAVTIFFGWLFLISGIVGLITTFWMRQAPGFWWSLLAAVLATVTGVLLIGWPVSGALSLTLLLIVFFALDGVFSIMLALAHRSEFSGRWGWLLFSGIVDLVLAAIILVGLPGTAAWALGLLVGINMIFSGAALISMALHARQGEPIPRPAMRAVG